MSYDSFAEASEKEREGMLALTPYLKRICDKAEFVFTGQSWYAQKCLGDIMVRQAGKAKFIELKVEEKHTGNLFLETWSNRSRLVPGWLFTCHADFLWYYFLDEKKLYTVAIPALKQWAYGHGDAGGLLYGEMEVRQGKYTQANDTWGRIVPIRKLKNYCDTFRGPIDPTEEKAQAELRQELLFA